MALGGVVYLWNAESGDITQLMQTSPENEEDYVTSVQWGADGKHIAVGTNAAEVQIWDVSRLKQVRTLRGHSARVGALAWNGTSLATGSRDNNIMMHDVRIREHCTATLTSHTQEVCRKWSPSGNQLASGGNDNLLHIWDHNSIGNGTHVHRLDAHQAAVKALAWSAPTCSPPAAAPPTAASSSGTPPPARCSTPWTRTRRCALQWNMHERELLSSHGYSQNQLCLWKYLTIRRSEFTGTARACCTWRRAGWNTVVTAAADETLRFWKCFSDDAGGGSKTKKAKESADGSVLRRFAFR